MADFPAIEAQGTFYVPAFDIIADGGTKLGRMKWDVIDVTYTDDIDAIDSFEFSLADWDPVAFEPVYSSPYDSKGDRKSYAGQTGALVPLLHPGAALSLSMGYLDKKDALDLKDPLQEMLRGHVVSLSSSFPAAGVPVARVRVMNSLNIFEKSTLKDKVKGGVLTVLAEVAKQLKVGFCDCEVPADIKAAHSGKTKPVTLLSEFKPLVDILRLARMIGMSVRLVHEKDKCKCKLSEFKDTLTLAPQPEVAYKMEWGKTLVSFTPTISTKHLVAKVIVRGHNPAATSPDKQKYEGKADWRDLALIDKHSLGAVMLAKVIEGLDDTQFVIDKPNEMQSLNATDTAKAHLRQLGADIIKGSGQTIGLPKLRAGARVELTKLGSTFSGIYEVTKTTHSFSASGYTTSFECRKEIYK